MSRVRSVQRVWPMNDFFGPIRGEKSWFFMNLKNPSGTWETLENTHLDLWKNTGPSRASLHVTRRAVVSRVIRVQRRYTVRIRPIRSVGLVHFGWFFELFIELYKICTHFSHIEYALRIHLVKISLIFIKYEPSTERSKGLAHERFFFLTHTWWKIMIFHEFEKPSWDLRNTRKHTPRPLEKHRSFASEALYDS